jgi:hypothetical protein
MRSTLALFFENIQHGIDYYKDLFDRKAADLKLQKSRLLQSLDAMKEELGEIRMQVASALKGAQWISILNLCFCVVLFGRAIGVI